MPSTVLIDPATGKAQAFDSDTDADSALKSGWHVPLNDAEGNPVSAPMIEARELINQGYSQPTDAQLGLLVDHAKYSTPGHKAGAFISGALEQLSGGIASQIEAEAGGRSLETQRKEQEINPTAHALGEAGGATVGTALLPEASIPGLVSHMGEAAAANIGREGFGLAAQMATRGALDAGAYTASHEIGEHLLGDPNSTGQHIASQIGFNAMLGAGFGVALSPIYKLMQKATVPGFAGREFGASKAMEAPDTLAEEIPQTGLSADEKQKLQLAITQRKRHADEIEAAGQRLGVPVLEGQLLDHPTAQKIDSALTKMVTPWGIKQQSLYKEGFDKVSSVMNEVLGLPLDMTRAEAGDSIKTGLTQKLSAEYQPIDEMYDAIKKVGRVVPQSELGLNRIADNIMEMPELKELGASSPEAKLAERVAGEIPQLETAEAVRRYTQRLRQDLWARDMQGRVIDPELAHFGDSIAQRLEDARASAIMKTAKAIPDFEREGLNITDLESRYAQAKDLFKQFKEKTSSLGEVLGGKLKSGQGARTFLNWLQDQPPEKIASRLFTKNDHEFLEWFKGAFPDEFNLLASLKRQEMREVKGAFVDGYLRPGKILEQIQGLQPEVRNLLFDPQSLQKIKDARTWLEAVPKNVNPSGTAETKEIFDMLRHPISGALTAGGSFATKKFLQALVKASPREAPKAIALLHIAQMAQKGALSVDKAAAGIFARAIGEETESHAKEQERIQKASEVTPVMVKEIERLNNDPESFTDHLATTLAPLRGHFPATVLGLTSTAGRGVSFLASKIPGTDKAAPLDGTPKISEAEQAKFMRYAQIVNKPELSLYHVKEGSLLPQDIEALSQVYPELYNSMREKVISKMSGFLSKHSPSLLPMKTRQGLSLFLGTDLDSSLLPKNLLRTSQMLGPRPPGPGPIPAPHKRQRPSAFKPDKVLDSLQTTFERTQTRKR